MSIEVLIVSDSPVVRAGLRAILEASGECRVAGEGSMVELDSLAATLRPEVVLLDLSAGEQEGLESLWRLAAEMPGLGAVVLSGDPGESLARQALEAGARAYLLRDASPEEIVEAVRAVRLGLTVLHPTTARTLLTRPTAQPPAAPSEPLTARETEVLQLLAQGLPSKTIASRLKVSEHTVKFHVGSIMSKLGAASRTEAVTMALRRGLIGL